MASYNRGMRLLAECGGVTTAVVEERMQRAPVFVLDGALQARAFGEWITEQFTEIKAVAESTTRVRATRLDRAVRRRSAALPPLRLHHR